MPELSLRDGPRLEGLEWGERAGGPQSPVPSPTPLAIGIHTFQFWKDSRKEKARDREREGRKRAQPTARSPLKGDLPPLKCGTHTMPDVLRAATDASTPASAPSRPPREMGSWGPTP